MKVMTKRLLIGLLGLISPKLFVLRETHAVINQRALFKVCVGVNVLFRLQTASCELTFWFETTLLERFNQTSQRGISSGDQERGQKMSRRSIQQLLTLGAKVSGWSYDIVLKNTAHFTVTSPG